MSGNAAVKHAHARLRPEDWPTDPFFGAASAGKVGMWIFLVSDALMFAGFLLAYGIRRAGSTTWRCTEALATTTGCAVEPILGIPFTAVLTFILICSSVSMVMAYAAVVERDHAATVKWLALTVLGGCLFLLGQAQEYFGILHFIPGFGHGLLAEGLVFGHSAYASTFYIITSFHGLHVFSGVVYISIILIRTALGKYDDGNQDHIEIVGLFWHFVDLIWILVFTLVYLIPID